MNGVEELTLLPQFMNYTYILMADKPTFLYHSYVAPKDIFMAYTDNSGTNTLYLL